MRRHFSTSELAEMSLPGLPVTLPRISDFITRVAQSSPELVHTRKGRGGGRVIDIAGLPSEARAELARRESAERLREEAEREAGKRQIAVAGSADLTARQRQVMEARRTVLLAIESRAAVAETTRRQAILAFLDDLAAGRFEDEQLRVIALANDKRGEVCKVSRATLYDWFAAFDASGLIGLAPELTRKAAPLPAWFEGFLDFYQRPSKPAMTEALREFLKAHPGVAISEKQVRVALQKMPSLARLKGREGMLALRVRMAYKARDFLPLLPTSVYSADGKTFDAEIAHPIHGQPFRPELTTIVDVGTRRIVGWSASLDENTHGVLDALRRACALAGVPAIFYTDRGPGYRNKAMDETLSGFLGRAGITPMRALPYNSQAKGVIERINQIYTASAKDMPTYLGKDMDKEAKLIAFKTTRRELALTGQSQLLPAWSDFLDEIDEAIEAYNNRPHSELPKVLDEQLGRKRHLTPNEFWARKCEGFEPIVPDQAELDDMFRPYVIRRTRRALVDWLGNSYFHAELEAFHGQDVAVGYDIRDAGKVWVRVIDEVDGVRVPGRLIAIAEFEGHKTRYVPLSFEQAAMERRNKGRLARVEKKAEVIRQELAPAALLDLKPVTVMPLPEAAPPIMPVPASPAALQESPLSETGQARRPIFRDEVSFARWIAAHPDQVTEADKAFLTDLLTDHSTKELLRMSGIDLEALRKLVRTDA